MKQRCTQYRTALCYRQADQYATYALVYSVSQPASCVSSLRWWTRVNVSSSYRSSSCSSLRRSFKVRNFHSVVKDEYSWHGVLKFTFKNWQILEIFVGTPHSLSHIVAWPYTVVIECFVLAVFEVVFLLSVLLTCGTASHHLFVSLHYRPSDEEYMMLICQVSWNVVSDVFILQVFLFFFFWQLLVFYCTLLSCSCCCACLICNFFFTFCEQK